MGALAEKRWDGDYLTDGAAPARRLRSLETERPAGADSSPSWNVLAEELVSYPPRHQRIWLEASVEPPRSYADAWLMNGTAALLGAGMLLVGRHLLRARGPAVSP